MQNKPKSGAALSTQLTKLVASRMQMCRLGTNAPDNSRRATQTLSSASGSRMSSEKKKCSVRV